MRTIYSLSLACSHNHDLDVVVQVWQKRILFAIENYWDPVHKGFYWLFNRKNEVLIDKKLSMGIHLQSMRLVPMRQPLMILLLWIMPKSVLIYYKFMRRDFFRWLLGKCLSETGLCLPVVVERRSKTLDVQYASHGGINCFIKAVEKTFTGEN
jgi:hypothetical protein